MIKTNRNSRVYRFKAKAFWILIRGFVLIGCLSLNLFSQTKEPDIVCWFGPLANREVGADLIEALNTGTGLVVESRYTKSYNEIIEAFTEKKPVMVFTGSFLSLVLIERGLAEPLTQMMEGKPFCAGIMIYPKGGDPVEILKSNPTLIAYGKCLSSGEGCAKAATDGKASVGAVDTHAAANKVKKGTAKAAFVRDGWWEGYKVHFPDFEVYRMPGISESKDPENLLLASVSIDPELRKKLASASKSGKRKFTDIDPKIMDFPKELMKKGRIDPLPYIWK